MTAMSGDHDDQEFKQMQTSLIEWRNRLADLRTDAEFAARVSRDVSFWVGLLDALAEDYFDSVAKTRTWTDEGWELPVKRFERSRVDFESQLDDLEKRAGPLRNLRSRLESQPD